MKRKVNTLLFMFAATLLNVALGAGSFIALYVVYSRWVSPRLEESARVWAVPAILLLAFVISFLVYHGVMRIFTRKVNMEKHFAPLFAPKRRR